MIIDFLRKKKAAVVAMGFLALIFSWIEFYLVYPVIGGIKSLKFSNIYEAIILMVKMVYNAIKYNNIISMWHVGLGVIVTIIIAAIISVAVMIILQNLNDFLDRRKVARLSGNFCRIWTVMTIASFVLEVAVIGIAIVILPALFVTSSYVSGKVGLSYCIFFDIVMSIVVMSATVYVRIPIWNSLKNIVSNTRRGVSNEKFLELVVKFIVFDVIYLVSRGVVLPLKLNSKGLLTDAVLFVVFLLFNLCYIVVKTYTIFKTLKREGIY